MHSDYNLLVVVIASLRRLTIIRVRQRKPCVNTHLN